MTAKPVPEHISDERLAKLVARMRTQAIETAEDHLPHAAREYAEVECALTELQHRREAEAGILAQDVIDLVIAARMVAYEDQSPEAIRALDKAAEAFAERVGWENDPDDEALSALGEHP